MPMDRLELGGRLPAMRTAILKSQRNRMQSCVATWEIDLIFLIIFDFEVTVTLGVSECSFPQQRI